MRSLLIAGMATLAAGGAALAQNMPASTPGGAPGITRAAVAAMVADRFGKIDANRDGTVTRAEFDTYEGQRRDRMDADRKQLRDRAFAKLDRDGNGNLSKGEFDTPPRQGPKGDAPPPPPVGHHEGGMGMMMGPRWFERADANGDGKVTLAEAQAAAATTFDRLDANHDGTLGPDEMPRPRRGGGHGGPEGGPPPQG